MAIRPVAYVVHSGKSPVSRETAAFIALKQLNRDGVTSATMQKAYKSLKSPSAFPSNGKQLSALKEAYANVCRFPVEDGADANMKSEILPLLEKRLAMAVVQFDVAKGKHGLDILDVTDMSENLSHRPNRDELRKVDVNFNYREGKNDVINVDVGVVCNRAIGTVEEVYVGRARARPPRLGHP